MSTTYKYSVESVDKNAKCMEILYTADGHEPMRIGARLPYEHESLEDVVRMYAPVRFWEEQQFSVIDVSVGAAGTITPVEYDDAYVLERKRLADVVAEQFIAKCLVKFGVLPQDPTSIGTTTL